MTTRKKDWHTHEWGDKSIVENPKVKEYLIKKGISQREMKKYKEISILIKEWMIKEARRARIADVISNTDKEEKV